MNKKSSKLKLRNKIKIISPYNELKTITLLLARRNISHNRWSIL